MLSSNEPHWVNHLYTGGIIILCISLGALKGYYNKLENNKLGIHNNPRVGDIMLTRETTTQEGIITMNIFEILELEEGFREAPYLCSEGYLTVGVGTKLSDVKGLDPKDYTMRVSQAQAFEWLASDISKFRASLIRSSQGRVFLDQNIERQTVLISMAYQMGTKGLLKFGRMWTALDNKEWKSAKYEALDSLWAKQTSARAKRHSEVLGGKSLDSQY